MKSHKKSKGFSLVELLVVIVIIVILSGVIITNISSSRIKARDGRRVSDLAQIQLALEQFFDRCQVYPAMAGTAPSTYVSTTSACPSDSAITLLNYISKLPTDPSTGSNYYYALDTSNNTDYFLRAVFELANPSSKDGLAAKPSYGAAAVTCSNVATSLNYCIGPK
ncbi:MAG: prepilin-type N-terminal cleavage/methylation domain-containing protein [Candidatus Paceibacterota bacterium]|jgi:general secretion pathway protein G